MGGCAAHAGLHWRTAFFLQRRMQAHLRLHYNGLCLMSMSRGASDRSHARTIGWQGPLSFRGSFQHAFWSLMMCKRVYCLLSLVVERGPNTNHLPMARHLCKGTGRRDEVSWEGYWMRLCCDLAIAPGGTISLGPGVLPSAPVAAVPRCVCGVWGVFLVPFTPQLATAKQKGLRFRRCGDPNGPVRPYLPAAPHAHSRAGGGRGPPTACTAHVWQHNASPASSLPGMKLAASCSLLWFACTILAHSAQHGKCMLMWRTGRMEYACQHGISKAGVKSIGLGGYLGAYA